MAGSQAFKMAGELFCSKNTCASEKLMLKYLSMADKCLCGKNIDGIVCTFHTTLPRVSLIFARPFTYCLCRR